MSDVLDAPPALADDAALAAFRGEVSQAIDGLVSGVLQLQDEQLVPLAGRTQGLEARVASLERQGELVTSLARSLKVVASELELERCCRYLARASRMARKSRTVVFVGRWHFGDNLKYAWLAALERAQAAGYECWYLPHDAAQEALVRSLGAPCLPSDYRRWSAADFLVAQRTAVLVVADHFFSAGYRPNPYAPALFEGARWVQLWHGISIKEVALKSPTRLDELTLFRTQMLDSCGPYAAFVGSSAEAEDEWRRWFGFERYANVGYPRSDVLLREPTERDLLNIDTPAFELARAARRAGARCVLYVPTFRDQLKGSWIYDAGLAEMAATLAARGDQLLVNLHPLEQAELPRLVAQYPQVRFLRQHCDLYPLLREVDLLVTDYSSLMFDFLPLGRPILFYRPDHERYITESRPLYDAKLKALPGALCATLEALLAAFAGDAVSLDAPYKPVREELAARLFDCIDDQASVRVARLVEDELELALR
jgi:CDP-glycerol glycerophosphotransferase